MKSYIQFLSTSGPETDGTALLLHFDDQRYIFGHIHEGMQRAGLDFGVRFLKVKDFFLTGKTQWSNTGGLMGLILTMADGVIAATASKAETRKQKAAMSRSEGSAGSDLNSRDAHVEDSTLRIHGGRNLAHTLATARRFIFRQGMPITVQEFQETTQSSEMQWRPDYEDDRIRLWAMSIKPEMTDRIESDKHSKSPRKRSLDEYMDGQLLSKTDQSGELIKMSDQWHQDQALRQNIVTEMFQSQWRYDRLAEVSLSEVKLPANIFVRDPATKKLSRYNGPLPGESSDVSDIKVLVRTAWPGALIETLPPTEPSSLSTSYILRNQKQRGKFRPAEAKRLGVKPGPLFSKLSNGESVASQDGKIVTPEMVLEPAKEGSGVVIVDLPSKEYIPSFLKRPELNVEDIMIGVRAFIWLLGPDVVSDERLLSFMQERADMQHIVSSPDVCDSDMMMQSAAIESIRHNQIDPDRYPPLTRFRSSTPHNEVKATSRNNAFIAAKQGLMLHLEPTIAVDNAPVRAALDIGLVERETPKEVLVHSKEAQNIIASESYIRKLSSQDLPSPDAEIICLGTGSSTPSKHRNVSATLLRVPDHGTYLLDCGENTLGQLQRMYSREELEATLSDLKLIWISHLHADHHLGTTSVMKAWYKTVKPSSSFEKVQGGDPSTIADNLTMNKLFVVSNPEMANWLHEYSSVEDFGYNHIIPLVTPHSKHRIEDSLIWNGIDVGFMTAKHPQIRRAIRSATGLSNLQYCDVSHCHGAHAVSLTFPTGFKFSYSGDCRPSNQLAAIGKGSTVLLHEATFDDDMQADAIAKKHSTMSEAIRLGMAMQARRILLTHFSQRYSKLPNMDDLDKSALGIENAQDVSDEADEEVMPHASFQRQLSASQLLQVIKNKDNDSLNTPDQDNISAPDSSPIPSPTNRDIKVGIAFDYMRVKVKDIMSLEKFNPAMRELYRERDENEGMERPESAFSNMMKDDIPPSKKKNQRREQEKNMLDKEREEGRKKKTKARN
ncbi:uncharacterized protein KY384_006604 [Bacidia gigantensis]|uniref:uncharacterized protein n=1 Tax=Bacidia gigantensis TaxID=2732470 RepID=UPI001D04F623|nr:uncharacterized protein KY384_006604 [Bacidia gigantensis]KAG8528915.1 hypothetical protein KY384_006604 [Bacidia gigantensis]